MGALRIGLTGGIGSGKSSVAAMLVARGAVLVDADAIARAMTEPGGVAMPAIGDAFGPAFIATDGSLDRVRMRDAAFADASTRLRLEAILHPLIAAEVARRSAESTASVDVFDIPLLVESGRWRTRVDQVWLVDCDQATQVARVAARPGWNADMALAVIARQASRQARRAVADAVINNDAPGLSQLSTQVDTLWHATLLDRQ